jgi:hypothetical protein
MEQAFIRPENSLLLLVYTFFSFRRGRKKTCKQEEEDMESERMERNFPYQLSSNYTIQRAHA